MHIHSRRSQESVQGLLSPPYAVRDSLLPSPRHLLARLVAWRRDRRALAELAGLSDRALDDIGLARWDVLRARRLPPRDLGW